MMTKIEIEVDPVVGMRLAKIATSMAQTSRSFRRDLRVCEALLEGHTHEDGSECQSLKLLEEAKRGLEIDERMAAWLGSVLDQYRATEEGGTVFAEAESSAEVVGRSERPLGTGA
jgi:hypothetical protein